MLLAYSLRQCVKEIYYIGCNLMHNTYISKCIVFVFLFFIIMFSHMTPSLMCIVACMLFHVLPLMFIN